MNKVKQQDKKGLLVVDVQNDFCLGGALEVPGSERVVQNIKYHIENNRATYHTLIFTKDWHIRPDTHFSDTPDYKDTWPRHCVADTYGAAIHRTLAPFSMGAAAKIILKGEYSAGYSGFDGHLVDSRTTLLEYLRSMDNMELVVCGLAFDYCVRSTAIDSAKYSFKTSVLMECTAAVSNSNNFRICDELESHKVTLISG